MRYMSPPLQSSGEHSLRLSDVFPSLADLTFDQIGDKSTIYLKAAALSRASADALRQHDIDPDSVKVDPNLIAEHSLITNQQGLPSLLRHLFDNLEFNTLQPLCPADSAIVEASMPGATALWDSLVAGSDVACLDTFSPSDKFLHGSVPPLGRALSAPVKLLPILLLTPRGLVCYLRPRGPLLLRHLL